MAIYVHAHAQLFMTRILNGLPYEISAVSPLTRRLHRLPNLLALDALDAMCRDDKLTVPEDTAIHRVSRQWIIILIGEVLGVLSMVGSISAPFHPCPQPAGGPS